MRNRRLCMRKRQGPSTEAVLSHEPGSGQSRQRRLHAVHARALAHAGFAAIWGRMFRFCRRRIRGDLLFHSAGVAYPSIVVMTRHSIRHRHVGNGSATCRLLHIRMAHLHASTGCRCRRPVQDER